MMATTKAEFILNGVTRDEAEWIARFVEVEFGRAYNEAVEKNLREWEDEMMNGTGKPDNIVGYLQSTQPER